MSEEGTVIECDSLSCINNESGWCAAVGIKVDGNEICNTYDHVFVEVPVETAVEMEHDERRLGSDRRKEYVELGSTEERRGEDRRHL